MNDGKWSDILTVKFPEIVSGLNWFVMMLSIRVLLILFIFVGRVNKGINRFEVIFSKNSDK